MLAPASEPPSLEGFFERVAAFNPFLDNRVSGLGPEVDVPGIHQSAFQQFTRLCREAQAAHSGLGVVLWGEAGVGKSHLLARLGRWADQGSACFAYLHNLQAAPEQLPRALLHIVLGILTQGRRAQFHRTPLFELVRAGLVEAVGQSAGHHSWEQLDHAYQGWLDRVLAAALPGGGDRTVYDVLFTLFRSASRARQGKEDGSAAILAVRWLSGQALDPVEARFLGLPPSRRREESVALEDQQQIKQVLVALARLAQSQGRPFVLAFDQVDNLDAAQFGALARFLEALIDSTSNLLAVTAGIQPTLQEWHSQRVVQQSAWDRLTQFEISPHRLSAAEARQVAEARVGAFRAPFAELDPVARLAVIDPLFPLGERWYTSALGGKSDLRPRDVINRARDGWRQQQADLLRLGGPAWLEGWLAVPPPEPPEAPPAAVRDLDAVIDQVTGDWIAGHIEARRRDRGGLPPNGDQMAGMVLDLLAQWRDADHLQGILGVEWMPPPRAGAQPTYHLSFKRETADGVVTTGLVVLTAQGANSVTGVLRRLREDSRPLDRVVVVTEERTGMPLGERGQEYLDELEQRGPHRFQTLELTFDEHAELEALQQVARAKDLEVEVRPGEVRPVSRAEVIVSNYRQGRYQGHRLLRELAAPASPPAHAEPAGEPEVLALEQEGT